MISNKQKWLLGGLVTLSAAIWTPQVIGLLGGDSRSKASVPAGPGEEEMLSIEMESTGQASGASVPSVRKLTPPPAAGGSDDSSSAASSDVSASNGHLVEGGSTAIVAEVLRTLRQTEAFSVDDGLNEPLDAVEARPLEQEAAPERPSLVVFIEAHPLRGTIVGESTNMALIGKYRVHLGDMVPGTGATLSKVERGRATLVEGSMTFELELNPLETSEELMNARSRSQGSGGAADLSQSNLPSSETPPVPATDDQTAPPSELPGSTGEF